MYTFFQTGIDLTFSLAYSRGDGIRKFIKLFTVTGFSQKYLLKAWGSILGTVTSMKFMTLYISSRNLKEQYKLNRSIVHLHKLYPLESK